MQKKRGTGRQFILPQLGRQLQHIPQSVILNTEKKTSAVYMKVSPGTWAANFVDLQVAGIILWKGRQDKTRRQDQKVLWTVHSDWVQLKTDLENFDG